MTRANASIRDYVQVRPHPTVVRLQDLEGADALWLSESFLLTPEVRDHLQALSRLLGRDSGSGVFLIGHYGSGKSHFLAYLTQQLRSGVLLKRAPDVRPVSLVNFSAVNRLEDIIGGALGIEIGGGDRRPAWEAMIATHPRGLVLVIDELSEFLRAKPDPHAFSEDVRFLQYLGEWAQDRPLWIIAAMQEGIEHTGELEHGLYRKIKDRYPLRLLLTPTHVKTLIADSILIKKPAYAELVGDLSRRLTGIYPPALLDFDTLRQVYPLHPATLDLLEEVRDRFSQARGIVDFTVTRLRGDPTRGVAPFLDRPAGELLTPEAIVDHFRDLLEVQPEFMALAQQVFPWHQRHLHELFDKPALHALAQRVLKLLVLVYLSPAREALSAQEAASWLLMSAARIEPDRNRRIIERVLATLAEQARYVSASGGRYRLDLKDDGGAALERVLAREKSAMQGQDALILETLLPLLPNRGFNPFTLPRDSWQHRRVLWHFHERPYSVWLGEGEPPPAQGMAICLRLPWGEAAPATGCYTVRPATLPVTEELLELAALIRVRETPGRPELARRAQGRLDSHGHLFQQAVRAAWQEAVLITPEGQQEPAPRLEATTTLESWLEAVALRALRRRYPAFERFAPAHGPLPKEAWLRFMRFATHEDLGAAEADDYVKLIREAYLVPMGLLRRRGREYRTPANLDRHELVQLLNPLLEHNPSPRTVHEHLAQPIYGLVPDQVNLLLVFLLLQGEIDIVKDRRSYRDSYETLPNPLQYDRLVPGHALGIEQVNALEELCEGLGIRTPADWSVLTQRRCARQLSEFRRHHVEALAPLVARLQELEQGRRLARRIQTHMDRWNPLDSGEHVLQGLEQFLFEIGPVSAFSDEVRSFQGLPQRVQRLMDETRRYTHLLQHPLLGEYLAQADAKALAEAPELDDPQAVEQWLERIAWVYGRYQEDYRARHQRYWKQVAEHPLWRWAPPPLARSAHLDLGETLAELERCRGEAERQCCRGLVDLDYQAQCSCGFDGQHAPITETLERFETLREDLETRMRLFFQQDAVKSRLRAWQSEGIEMNSATLSYLQGRRPVPEVRDVAELDRYLSGAELVTRLDIRPVMELLTQRAWEPGALIRELGRLLERHRGKRLRFTGAAREALPDGLLQWCARQCLEQGAPLPDGLDRGARAGITQALCTEWVSAAALQHLEGLGLDAQGVDRVLGWVMEGHCPLPEGDWPRHSLMGAAADLLQGPTTAQDPKALATIAEDLYRAHGRLARLAGQRWLEHLDALAHSVLPQPADLTSLLKGQEEAQWLLIDCLGLPLLGPLEPVLLKALSEWEAQAPRFATVGPDTTTDGCYRDLLEAAINHDLHKIDVVDELIHEGATPFQELIALASARLEGALQRQVARLDPKRALLVFADHGFRLARDGRGYTHGGDSTLERVVPVWCLGSG
jgi:hypothetical protein